MTMHVFCSSLPAAVRNSSAGLSLAGAPAAEETRPKGRSSAPSQMASPASAAADAPEAAAPAHAVLAARAASDPAWVRWLLISVSLVFLTLFLFAPVAAVFAEALRKGMGAYLASFADVHALAAIRLTLLVSAIAVPLNVVFGLAASWAIAKFEFWGKNVLLTLIDLPLAVSPVISGLVFMMLFGMRGWFGPFLMEHDIEIMFAVPGIVLATVFVTFPFVARELIPVMQEQGAEEEQAALVLGASGWMTFRRVTLPNVKWALLYGVILCNARAMGEFGAVSVVSGSIRGRTNTLPLHVEILYNEYNFVAAFAVSSLLVLLALLTLAAKNVLERRRLGDGHGAA